MLVVDVGAPGGERVKLLDFGIAKVSIENQAADSDMVRTRVGMFMGSPLYMSPEQCRGADKVELPSDVYSLGAVLYHLLSGAPPFAAASTAVVIGGHLFDQPAPLLRQAPQVSPRLAALVERMLRKPPVERPTMDEVVTELTQLLRARQPEVSAWLRFRRRFAVGAVLSLVGLLAIWVVLGTSATSLRPQQRVTSCNPAGFCRQPLPVDTARLRGVFALAPDDVWACGDSGILIHFDGASWRTAQRGIGNRLHHIFGLSAQDIWAVGDAGTILHFNGRTWNRVLSGSTAYLTGVWASSPRDLWIVGKVADGQEPILHSDGQDWESRSLVGDNNLLTIWGAGSDDIWAAGNGGTLIHYNGKRWQASSGVATKQKLTGLWGTSGSDVWAAGHGGALLHFGGDRWSVVATPTSQNLNHGYSSNEQDVWVVGDQGLILHREGGSFKAVDSGVSSDLDHTFGLRVAGTLHLWSVGNPATLLKYNK